MSDRKGLDFIVDKSEWHKTQFSDSDAPAALAPGQVLFRIDRFAFTSNNISYALSGEMLKYWQFFPADEGLGRIPAMGFAEVIDSKHDGVEIGTRCFGFYPMSKYLLIEPASASPTSIMDGALHRKEISPTYNQYQPVSGDALYSADHEDELMLMRGLFMTSFLADDFLADSDHYGAESVIISSASSKTSIALGFRVSEQGKARAIGLTSAGNLEFVKNLGFYNEVLTYDEIESIDSSIASVYVDMAGNTQVSRRVHEHMGSRLKFSQRIGGTHWEAGGGDGNLPGPQREFFFAPSQIQKRIKDWGPQGLQERLGKSWSNFQDASKNWLTVERGYGREAVERVYQSVLAGKSAPNIGHVISLWDNEAEASGS